MFYLEIDLCKNKFNLNSFEKKLLKQIFVKKT